MLSNSCISSGNNLLMMFGAGTFVCGLCVLSADGTHAERGWNAGQVLCDCMQAWADDDKLIDWQGQGDAKLCESRETWNRDRMQVEQYILLSWLIWNDANWHSFLPRKTYEQVGCCVHARSLRHRKSIVLRCQLECRKIWTQLEDACFAQIMDGVGCGTLNGFWFWMNAVCVHRTQRSWTQPVFIETLCSRTQLNAQLNAKTLNVCSRAAKSVTNIGRSWWDACFADWSEVVWRVGVGADS